MPKTKLLFHKICPLVVCIGLGSCSPSIHFDYRTSRKAENLKQPDEKEPADAMAAFAEAGELDSDKGNDANQPATDLTPKPFRPVSDYYQGGKSLPMPAKSPPAALVSAKGKVITISRQEWKRVVQSLGSTSRKKAGLLQQEAAASAQNPFNQGILAGFLILAVGTGIILLGSLLPSIGTILAWVLGVSVLLVGLAFLALTLAGFSVRIIG